MRELDPIKYIAVLDLETGAKTPDAHIYSIGVSVIDVENLCIAADLYYRIDDNQPGRVKDASTLGFWLKQAEQSPDAFDELFCNAFDDKPLPLKNALVALTEWLVSFGDPKSMHLMGNGSEFDNVILDHAINKAGLKNPIPYWNNQSLRTIKLVHRLLNGDMASNALEQMPFEGRKHHALDDAQHEAKQLLLVLKTIRGYQAYDQDIAQLKEQLQHQKLVCEQKLKEVDYEVLKKVRDNESLVQLASAWDKVCATLDDVSPGWLAYEGSAVDCAVFAIYQMAGKKQPWPKPMPNKSVESFKKTKEIPVEVGEAEEEIVYISPGT